MLNSEELLKINGGASITGALLNAVVRVVNVALEVGRTLGSAIRRGISGKLCSF